MSTILLSVFLLSLTFANVRSRSPANSTQLVTSPETCFSNFECASDEFCYNGGPYNPVQECRRRTAIGQKCQGAGAYNADLRRFEDSCYPGQVCLSNGGKRICMAKLSTGDACGDDVIGACPQDNRCRENSDGNFVCAPIVKGAAGSACSKFKSCSEDLSLYCKDKVCTVKQGTGASCKSDWECQSDVCMGSRKCAPLQKSGQACTRNWHCEGASGVVEDENYAYCNKRQIFPEYGNSPTINDIGLCARDSELIKTPGAECSPKRDFCDYRRGLSCEREKSTRRFVCQQRMLGGYCTPGSRYSKCLPKDYPRKCYVARDSGLWYEANWRFHQCNPKREKVPLGFACNRGGLDPICPKGAKCERIDGILENGPSMGGSPFLKACVYLRDEGESCENKFEAKCKKGLKCEDGKCVVGTPKYGEETHADFYQPCDELQCIPGAECVGGKSKICIKPSIVVKLGEPCVETAKFRKVCNKISSFYKILYFFCIYIYIFYVDN